MEITKNSFQRGRSTDVDPSVVANDSYLEAHNVTLTGDSKFLALENIKGTVEVGEVVAGSNVMAVYSNRYLIEGVETQCLTIFASQTNKFQIFAYDPATDTSYQLLDQTYTGYAALTPTLDAYLYPEQGVDVIYFTDGLNEMRKLRCEILDAGDLHVGTVTCHYAGIDKMVEWIKEKPNRYLNLKGDLIEAIVPGDKRFSMRSVDLRFKTPKDQADYLVERLKPIADNIIGLCIGNHELKLLGTFDVVEYIASALGISKHAYGAGIYKFISTYKGRVKFKALFVHGHRHLPAGAKDPIQRLANQKAAQKRILEELGIADCVYSSQGHSHQLLVVEPTVEASLYLTDNGKYIQQHHRVRHKQNSEYIPSESRWFCCTGSFMKAYTDPGSYAMSYAEGKYAPSELGCVKITVEDGEVVHAEPFLV